MRFSYLMCTLTFLSNFCVKDGKESVVKEVYPGDSVHSLLSILDVITVGHARVLILRQYMPGIICTQR